MTPRTGPVLLRTLEAASPFKPAGAWADRIGDTWIFNPGRQIGLVPAHVEIDLALGAAPPAEPCQLQIPGATALLDLLDIVMYLGQSAASRVCRA